MRVCGCSHSHLRRRSAPCRTPGYNLSPALDLDVDHAFQAAVVPTDVRQGVKGTRAKLPAHAGPVEVGTPPHRHLFAIS